MQTTYEKNLKTLARFFDGMDELIETAKEQLEPELEVLEETAYNEQPILKIKKDGQTYYLNGKRNPEEPAQMWMQGIGKLYKNAPIFMVGVGNYTYLKELVEQTEESVTIIVYEPSLQIFLKFIEQVDLERWMEKHVIIFWVEGIPGMTLERLGRVLSPVLEYDLLPFARELILPNYEMLFPEQTLEFMKRIRDIAHANRLNFNTQDKFAKVTVKNLLQNMMHLCKAYKSTQLVDVIPRDIPGIVVAAGPSLNKNIKELKKAKGKAFILAVDTAIKPLLDEGIIPDMFAIVDGVKPLSLVEREEARNIPLLCTIVSASEVLNYHTGMKFMFNEGYRYAEMIFSASSARPGGIASGGSVATHAFSLLYKIGLKRIILVGQDLALTGNKTHADGTFQDKMEEIDTKNAIMVEGNYEEKVPTRYDFQNYLKWYDDYIAGCQKSFEDFRVINATEGGAKIKGTEIMTLKEAIEKECTKEVDIQECLARLKPMLDEDGQNYAKEVIRNIPNDLKQLASEAAKTRKLYKKLDKICDRRNIDRKEYLSILKRIEKSVKAIEGGPAYELVELTLVKAQFILKNERYVSEDSIQKEGKEIARKGILYMENVEACAKLFEELMTDILRDNEYLWD